MICLSRAASHAESLVRLQASLATRQRSLSPAALAKVTSLAADPNVDQLGLSTEEYGSVRDAATIIVHNAWPVNFNISLQSFRPHIQGAINLLNLALQSPQPGGAKFFFSSSVATMSTERGPVKETFPLQPATAGSMGYGRSKWVVEKVMQSIGPRARCGVLRIGQLCGDTDKGVWVSFSSAVTFC